jgi:hypothetical protein
LAKIQAWGRGSLKFERGFVTAQAALEVSQTTRPRIALDFGPDHVLFPNLANQPILDLLLRRDLWDHVKAADGTELWQAFGYYSGHGKERLITPSLPNRFLAILPANMAEHPQWKEPDVQDRSGAARYAAELENVIRQRLREIGESVSDHCRGKEALGFDAARFSNQIEKLLEVHWQVVPWPEKIEDALDAAAAVPGEDGKHPLDAIRAVQLCSIACRSNTVTRNASGTATCENRTRPVLLLKCPTPGLHSTP